MATSSDPLTLLRQQIDEIDDQLQTLITQRFALSQKVADAKKQSQENPVIYRPEREAQMLRKILERNKSPLPDEELAKIFRAILSASRALQQPTRVVFLGAKDSLSHIAAIEHFGPSIIAMPIDQLEKIFSSIHSKVADYGVITIDNSQEGIDRTTLDLLAKSDLNICGEIEIMKNNTAQTFRFFIIGAQEVPPSGHDKTTLTFTTSNSPGALANMLKIFEKHGINITLIESRPLPHNKSNYIFFLDIEGHQTQPEIHAAMQALAKQKLTIHVLGSYPRAVI